ncbi:MAG TPA: hypothetical protein VHH36_07195, partial [Candidatus Thermoplasmatota archaeon]|nr:hypothetical protein [Candidatus Thermoplasmatota archaeon]
MRSIARPVALLLAIAFASVGLAGCLQPDGPGAEDEPQFAVNREVSIAFGTDFFDAAIAQDQERMQRIAEDAVRMSLVVHVGRAGDYVLRYTDRDGEEREARLDGMIPGRPHEVNNVDPLKPATLLSGSEVVAQRRALEGDWWTVAGVPVGVTFGDGATATYRASGTTAYGFQVRDLV